MERRATLRVGILGAGAMGRRHADAAVAAGDRVSAVHDADPRRAAELAAEHPGAVAVPEAELAEHADVVVVATPSPLHLAQTTRALQAGRDVLVEKPHRIPGEPADPLLAALEASGRRCMVGMTTRHRPGIGAVGEAVRSGALGTLLGYDDAIHFALPPGALPDWYFDPARSGGGVLLTNGVHALDRARAILGTDLVVDDARLTRVFPAHLAEDSAEIRLRTPDGIPVQISLLWAPVAAPGPALRVRGTRGAAIVRQDGSWELVTEDGVTTGGPVAEQESFARQWQAFRDGEPGFSVPDLEPALGLIEEIYRRCPVEP
jgi:predicted dehydrogenase